LNSLQHTVYDALAEALDKRKENGLYRSLQLNKNLIDFCSNDYLGFSRSEKLKENVNQQMKQWSHLSGSTGSRSISGNSELVEQLEKQIAAFHHAENGLMFNSGYDANLGLFSSIAQKNDTIICDELIHASIIDGCRLSHATRYRFAHNSILDLEKKLQLAKGVIFVAVESVYSMDGDMAPLKEIAELCQRYNANLIVDEAHATGVFGEQGKGKVCELGLEKQIFARVHTFGKAMGSHGAIVLGNTLLRNYLINFARSFIFTTALPTHSLLTTKCAYEQLQATDPIAIGFDRSHLQRLIACFKNKFIGKEDVFLIESNSPIQSVVIPGNGRARSVSKQLQNAGFDVRAILSPSVPAGKERLRISLHLHNTIEQTEALGNTLNKILFNE
jgi:8-amino-7-oxononanoate synthase